MTKQNYIQQYLPLAQRAGERFGMNPIIILAQSAIETGWGESELAREYNNFLVSPPTAVRILSGMVAGQTCLPQEIGRPSGSAGISLRKIVFSTSPV